ncbi:hypothetical protein NXF25_009540 [Crotalus adamanteus]|uniref:Myb/SANT-like DNA-binding domain-containing protein n=1 Tax=Crotalus adamanteus TaxID=8729 RepID=A0AAW1BRU1_CROAD
MNIQSFAPRKSIRHRNPYWPDEEIRTFIEIWGDDQVQASLATNFRNEAQYEWISDRMRECGYDRDMKQCRLRAKELRRGYKAIVCGNNSSMMNGNRMKKMAFLREMWLHLISLIQEEMVIPSAQAHLALFPGHPWLMLTE